MAYFDISEMVADQDLTRRVAACAAEQRQAGADLNNEDPYFWAVTRQWEWASAPGWDDAYAYAKETGNEDPGKDPTVITDAMILSQVQSMLAPPPGDE